jgi:hypothetical protein
MATYRKLAQLRRLVVAAAILAPSAVGAQPAWGYRQSEFYLGGWNFERTDFSQAGAYYGPFVIGDAARSTIGTTTGVELITKTGAQNFSWTGDGTYVTVSNVQRPSLALATADITQNTLTPGSPRYPGSMFWSYTTMAVPEGPGASDVSWVTYGTYGGRHGLTLRGGGSGFLEPGGRFLVLVVMYGDWTNPADWSVTDLAPGWTFSGGDYFDGLQTEFYVENPSYGGDVTALAAGDAFTIQFLGATAVPEPRSVRLLAVGVVLLGIVAHRRRSL